MSVDSTPTGQTAGAGSLVKEFYFPTQIYFKDLPNGEALNAALLPFLYRCREEDRAGIVRSNLPSLDAWHSSVDLHHRPELATFMHGLMDTMQQVFDDLRYHPSYEPVCGNLWANINPRYAYNRAHTHPHALWSGAYYLQCPPGCGRIYFHDPRTQAHVMNPRFDPERERAAESWSEVYFEPIPGRLLLFPAWLLHEVQPNVTESAGEAADRVSISFNYHQRLRAGARAEVPAGHDSKGGVTRSRLPPAG